MGSIFSKSLKFFEKDCRTISIETGIQNGALGLVLIFNFFDGLGGMAVMMGGGRLGIFFQDWQLPTTGRETHPRRSTGFQPAPHYSDTFHFACVMSSYLIPFFEIQGTKKPKKPLSLTMLHPIIQLYKASFIGLSRNVWLLSIIMLINRSGTMVIPFLGIFLTQEEGFSIIQTGYIMSFIGLGSVLGTYIGGRITDAVGHYGVQFWSLILSGIGFLIMPFVEGFVAWCATIFIVIAISDAFRPANQAAIGFYSKEENRTRSMSLVRLAINLGFAAGPAIGGIVAVAFGYNWLFVLDGLTCIGAALVFLYALPNDKKAERNKQKILDTSISNTPIQVVQSPYKDTYFLLFVACNMLMAIAFVQFMMAMPIYFKETLKLSENLIGLLLGINGLFIAIVEMPYVYAYEKKQYKKLPTIILGTAFVGFAYLVLLTSSFVGIAALCMFILTIGEIISFPFSATYALNKAAPENRGAYMGLFGISWSLALIISPLLTSWLIEDYGYSMTWLVIGALPVLGSLGMYYLYQKDLA